MGTCIHIYIPVFSSVSQMFMPSLSWIPADKVCNFYSYHLFIDLVKAFDQTPTGI